MSTTTSDESYGSNRSRKSRLKKRRRRRDEVVKFRLSTLHVSTVLVNGEMAYSRPYPAPPQAYAGSSGPAPPSAQPTNVPPTIAVPPGTLPPGTIVNVGDYQVVVDRFLSEGELSFPVVASISLLPLRMTMS